MTCLGPSDRTACSGSALTPRAGELRWPARGAQLITNLLDEQVGEIVTRAWLERRPGA
jgi:hypothetical protein